MGRIIIDTALDNSGFERGYKQAEAATRSFVSRVSQNIAGIEKSFTGTTAAIMKQQVVVDELKRKIQALADVETKAPIFEQLTNDLQVAESEVSKLTSEYEQALAVVEELKGMGFAEVYLKPQIAEVDSLAERLFAAEEKASGLRQELLNLDMPKQPKESAEELAVKLEIATTKLREMELKTSQTGASVKNLGSTMASTGLSARQMGGAIGLAVSGSGNLTSIIRTLSSMLFMMGGAMDIVKLKATAMWAAITLGVSLAINGIMKLVEMFSGMTDKYKETIDDIKSSIKNLPIIAKKITDKFIDVFAVSLKNITKNLDNLIKKIVNFGKSTVVFNQVQTAIKEVANILADAIIANKDFANSLNAIKVNSLTAFATLYQYALPYVIKLMQALATVTAYVAKLMAMLFGTTYSNAKKSAEALYDTAKANDFVAKSAKKATREANKQLAPFDELNVLANDMADAVSGTTDDIGDGLDFAIEEPDIGWMDALTEKLKSILDIIDTKYWGELGNNIANWIADQLDKIPWDVIRVKANALGQNIGAFLGGLFGNVRMWESIGMTIAQGFNTVLEFLNGVATAFPWDKVGKAIAAGINSFVEWIDAKLHADTINKWAIGILDLLIAAVGEIKWEKLGQKITSTLNNIKWVEILTKIGITIREALKGILTTTYEIFTDNQWAIDFATGLASGLNEVLSDEGLLSKIGETLAALINTLLLSVATFAKEFDWVGAAEAIATGLNKMLESVDPQDVADAINAIVDGILDFLTIFFESVPPERILEIAQAIVDAIDFDKVVQIISKIDAIKEIPSKIFEMITTEIKRISFADFFVKWSLLGLAEKLRHGLQGELSESQKDFATAGIDLIQALLNGILDKMWGIGDWIKENITDPMINAVKKLFGIQEHSKVMEDLGISTIEGLYKGISGLVEKITKPFTEIKTKVTEIWEGLSQNIRGVINSILSGVETFANGIIRAFNAVITALNSLSINIPDWIPGIGGKSLGFSIRSIPEVSIPRLATGTVVPPNKEFMAILGDNKNEPEIVSPLSTMKQAFKEALAEGGGTDSPLMRRMVELLEAIAAKEGNVVFVPSADAGRAISRSQLMYEAVKG